MITTALTNFMVYLGNNVMGDVADVTLPSFTYLTQEVSGAGIAGSIEMPIPGNFGSLVLSINWRAPSDDNVALLAAKAHVLTIRGSLSCHEATTGNLVNRSIRIVARTFTKELNLGAFAPASAIGTSGTFELNYIKIYVDDVEVIEIDKIANICRINGDDDLSEIRRQLGML